MEGTNCYDDQGNVLWSVLESTAAERIINSVHSFCLFMRCLRVPDDLVLIPPDGGWPDISKETFVGLGKNNRVIQVLRHMTYLKSRADQQQILPENALMNWSKFKEIPANSDEAEGARMCTEHPSEPAPADVVGLLCGGRNTGILLLDCKYGIVHWSSNCNDDSWKDFGGGCHLQRLPPENGEDATRLLNETNWMVQDFFEIIKRKFRSMEQLPYGAYEVLDDRGEKHYRGAMKALRDIYQKNGWPDDYQKESCLRALKEFDVTDFW